MKHSTKPGKKKDDTQSNGHFASSFCGDRNLESFVFRTTFIVSLGIYLQTVSPSIAGGDAGELVAEGCALGTSHPPGYPLYTVLVYAVTQFRIHLVNAYDCNISPAFCVNVMSCIFGSLASAFIATNVLLLSMRKSEARYALIKTSCAITTGLLHTLSPLAWQYSVTAEVFALHNFFVSWILYSTIQCAIHKKKNNILKGAFIAGLSLANQHTSILLEIPIIFWISISVLEIHKRTSISTRILQQSAIFFLLGLLPYALLPYFATKFPHAGSWGNVTSMKGFLHHLQRKDYGTFQLYSGKDDGNEGLLARAYLYLQDFILVQGTPVFFVFFCFGIMTLGRDIHFSQSLKETSSSTRGLSCNTCGIGRAIISSLLFYLVVFHSLANLPLQNKLLFGIHQRFWMHPNIICFIIGGVGLSYAVQCVIQSVSSFPTGCTQNILTFAIPVTNLAFLLWIFSKNIHQSDQSTNLVFHNYAKGILDTLPPQSLLLINYDQQWTSIRYFQECEHYRQDITSINLSMMSYEWWSTKRSLYPTITFPGSHYSYDVNGNGFSFGEFVDANYDTFPNRIFLGGNLNYQDNYYQLEYMEVPHGMTRQLRKRNRVLQIQDFYLQSLQAWKIIARYHANDLPNEEKYPQETWEWTVKREFYDHLVFRANHLLDMAVLLDNSSKNGDEIVTNSTTLDSIVDAAAWLELALAKDDMTSRSHSVKKNLGIAYLHMVRNKEAHGINHPPLLRNIFGTNFTKIGSNPHPLWRKTKAWREKDPWKTWASGKWSKAWRDFLKMEGAKDDPGYEQIKSIYDQVMASARKQN